MRRMPKAAGGEMQGGLRGGQDRATEEGGVAAAARYLPETCPRAWYVEASSRERGRRTASFATISSRRSGTAPPTRIGASVATVATGSSGKGKGPSCCRLSRMDVTCLACVRSAVLDSAEAAPVYKDILHFFDETLGLSVPADMWDIPVLLVEMPTLNERQTDRHIGERQEGGPASSMTRGLCLSEVGKVSHFDSGGVRFDRRTGKFSFSAPKVRFLHETRAVTAILVLHGLPRDLCGSILAHEAMHAWIKLNPQAPADLPDQVEEGLCQLIAHLWLQKRQADASNPSIPGAAGGAAGAAAGRGGSHFDQPRTQSETTSSALSVTPSDEELRSFFLYQIETDQSLVYGDGFRAAMRAHSVLGLRELLDFVAKHHVFPIV